MAAAERLQQRQRAADERAAAIERTRRAAALQAKQTALAVQEEKEWRREEEEVLRRARERVAGGRSPPHGDESGAPERREPAPRGSHSGSTLALEQAGVRLVRRGVGDLSEARHFSMRSAAWPERVGKGARLSSWSD